MIDLRVSGGEAAWKTRCAVIRAHFDATGTNISEWARERGFAPKLVYMILAGDRACVRGESHRIAVALGLKPQVPDLNVPDARFCGVDQRAGAHV